MQTAFQAAFADTFFPTIVGSAEISSTPSGFTGGVGLDRTLRGVNDTGQVPLGGPLAAGNAPTFWHMPNLGQVSHLCRRKYKK